MAHFPICRRGQRLNFRSKWNLDKDCCLQFFYGSSVIQAIDEFIS
ncbi:hypothetical protein HanXRQr2_Chr11g0470241 [Helianthus annuus]|uniref:Uncharacterized protein n=1 Tax=Helianthus annuus TaxID=4232 RepID=A0A9K3HKU2_HELAN|nr:hypothetical protein HanXRQr2_Chr11g0470231 [Helianthus annuus]KAF5780289.1 hypothetical protein HanXRQr2_Chr11g0470241 [Helianthus annuus]